MLDSPITQSSDADTQPQRAALDAPVLPKISIVIPTYRRPELVYRAVQSVLNQTFRDIEVIVVIDGTEPETRSHLLALADDRLRVLESGQNQGSALTRNQGVTAARAQWIAFLDDDDEWLPTKLERQFEVLARSPYSLPIISCRLIARMPEQDEHWPRRFPDSSEPLGDYLFIRNGLFQGEAVIQTSTILTAKSLLQQVPYLQDKACHDDWDWLLRAIAVPGVGIEFVPESLSIWHLGGDRTSLSRATGNQWRKSWQWIRSQKDVVTPRAYASFLLTEVGTRAAHAKAWQVFLPLLWEMIRCGKPTVKDLALYIGMWIVPSSIRTRLRALLTRTHR
jgi:glycosyltransferase involved in cell wall biosynthesis